jgi:predicted ATPase
MSRIRIKNFGPIKEGNVENDGWIDIKKVTVFIGEQGSGKSTVAKLISTFTWLEKALVRGDFTREYFQNGELSFIQLLKYHRLENYLIEPLAVGKSSIEFEGDAFSITWDGILLSVDNSTHIQKVDNSLAQIMYVPAERNFLSYVRSPSELKLSSDSLKEFLAEYDNAKEIIDQPLELPVGNVDLEYNKTQEVLYLKGKDYKIRLTDASSGYQSLVPLFLVSRYLANNVMLDRWANNKPMSLEEQKRFQKATKEIYSNDDLTDDQKRAAISALAMRFNKTAFVNIVEEPEQNLYPTSQRQMLNSLMKFNNQSPNNKLIMTTHSPYLINYLTLAVKADSIIRNSNNLDATYLINEIVPRKSLLRSDDLVIYELKDDGTICFLKSYHGLPSDENSLNEELSETNELFAQLLEIQQTL